MNRGRQAAALAQRWGAFLLDRHPELRADGKVAAGVPLWHMPLLALALFALIIAGTGSLLYLSAKRAVTQATHDNLEAIAKLKVTEIEHWLDERHKDTWFATQTPAFAADLENWLKGGLRDDRGRERLLDHLRRMSAVWHYRDVGIRAAADGALLLSGSGRADAAPERTHAAAAARGMKPVFGDLHLRSAAADPADMDIDFYFPISQAGKAQALAVVAIQASPADYLFPLLTLWPGSSPSAETLIFRTEGQELVFLNTPRHSTAAALRLRLPLANPQRLATQAARGQLGPLAGIDYRDVPSLGYALPVAGTNWLMIAKIDAAEAYALLNTAALGAAVAAVILLLLAAWWIFEHSRHAEVRYRQHFERELLLKRLDFLSRYANDTLVLTDLNGAIVEANERSEITYGYTREELIGMNVGALRAPHLREDVQMKVKRLMARECLVYETENLHKDGHVFPVEISASMIEIDGQCYFQGVIRDITERKRMEQALQASEERFRQAFDHAPIGMAMLGLDGRFLAVNPATCRLTGYSRDELTAMNFRDITYPVDVDQEADWLAALDACGNGCKAVEKRAVSKDGRILYLSINRTLVRGADGSPLYVLSQTQDITARMAAVARIQRLSQLKAAISETNRALIHSRSPQEVYEAVCQACVEHGCFWLAWVGLADPATQRIRPVAVAGPAAGYVDGIVIGTRADVPEGRGPSAIAYREQRPYICNDFSADPAIAPWRARAAAYSLASLIALPMQRGGKPYGTLTVYGPEKDFFDEESVSLLTGMAENISFAIGQFDRDEQRRQAEQELRQSEEKFRTLVESMPQNVFVKDANLAFVSCNAHYARRLGTTPEQMVGKTDFDFYPAALAEKYENDSRRVMASGEAADFQEDCMADGRERFVHTIRAPVRNDHGQVVGVLGVSWDITEHRKLEHEQRRQARRIGELSHRLVAVQEDERRRLAGELHDRASPNLAAIKITLKTLAGALPVQVLAEADTCLADAQALVDDTTAGIREICAELRPTVLDYAGLIPALEGYAERFMKRTAVVVRVKSPQDGVRLGTNTESALFRIVQEALTNCAKHACAKKIDIEFASSGSHLTLTIKDDGFGFDPDALAQSANMSGLGLITMKERAEFVGGKFVVASHPLEGTEIRVELENQDKLLN